MEKPIVISVAAVSGGGKTTVINVAPYIDYTIFIDTPLDIAMARRILRDNIKQPSNLLKDDLECYLSRGRIAYLEAINTIKPNSDLIVDGSLSVDNIVCQIMERIAKLNQLKYF